MRWSVAILFLGSVCSLAQAAGTADTPVEITTVDLSPAYPCNPAKDVDKRFAPEIPEMDALLSDKGDVASKEHAGAVVWKPEVDLFDGQLDLNETLHGSPQAVAYARVRFNAEAAGTMRLSLGSTGAVKAMINGTTVFHTNAASLFSPGVAQANVPLVRGENVLLVRLMHDTGAFRLQLGARTVAPIGITQIHDPSVRKWPLTFKLEAPGLTSAGVFDATGRLVRTLWAMRSMAAGSATRNWDGTDDTGHSAPDGDYTYKVIVNGCMYTNVGSIGNSGKPYSTTNHIPNHIEALTVAPDGGIYAINWWDEAGADFKKWSPSGESVYDAHFQIRNGKPNGLGYGIAVDDRYLYCAVSDNGSKAYQIVRRFDIRDGKAVKFADTNLPSGNIQVYANVSQAIGPADAGVDKRALRGLAVLGDTLFVTDTVSNRVLRFNKETGAPQGEFPVQRPYRLAVDAAGRIWVGHERHNISVFKADGQFVDLVLTNISAIASLSFDPKGQLVVADRDAGQIQFYDVSIKPARLVSTFGQKAQPGDRAADHFFNIRGAGVDAQGNLVVAQTEPLMCAGARLARWSPEGKLLWEHYGLEFVSLGNYGTNDPDAFYSTDFHRYRLLDHNAGTWDYLGHTFQGGKLLKSYAHGVPRVLRLGTNDFFFAPTGDGVQVYRVDGSVLRLAAMVGGSDPRPNGVTTNGTSEWSWHDAKGTATPTNDEIQVFKEPGKWGAYSCFGMDVDAHGNIWFADHGIWEIPLASLDERGNPVYDWSKARAVVPKADDKSPTAFYPNMVQAAADGSFYAFGWSKAWPAPNNNPFWMGGTTLVRYDTSGARLWAVRLPKTAVGLDVIPGGAGGCLVGMADSAAFLHYTADGLLIGSIKPGAAMCYQTGWLDCHASVAVNRDPRDGLLDVFTEDDLTLRFGWYRVDDRHLVMLTGKLTIAR